MDKVKYQPMLEIIPDDFNAEQDNIETALQMLLNDFLTDTSVVSAVVSGLKVRAQAVPNMTVYVEAGRIYQNGLQGIQAAALAQPLTIAAADATYTRIDRIVAQYSAIDGQPETRNKLVDVNTKQITQAVVNTRTFGAITYQVVQGTASANPMPPAIPTGCISLAQVIVHPGVSNIQDVDILDERPTIRTLLAHAHTGGLDGAQIDHTKGLTNVGTYTHAQIDAHINRTDNPHQVTAAQVGAVTTPTPNKLLLLDANGKLPTSITGDAATVGGKHASDITNDAINWVKGYGLGNYANYFSGNIDQTNWYTGFYYVMSDATGTKPSLYGHMIVIAEAPITTIKQIWLQNDINNMFIRQCVNGTWSSWKQLATTDGAVSNSDKVDGYHAGTGANQVLVLDGSGKVPTANLPPIDAVTLQGNPASAFALAGHTTHVGEQLSLQQNGYFKMANGLIIQWGVYMNSLGGTYTVTLPIAFPHAIFTIIGNTYGAISTDSDIYSNTVGPDGTSLSTIKVTIDCSTPTAWIAIGY